MKAFRDIGLALCALLVSLPARAATYPPKPAGPVGDFAEVLSPGDEARIAELSQKALREKGIPIVVATIKSLAGQDAAGWTIERYATNLFNEWGVGSPPRNQGLLLLVAVNDRKLRIATGAGFGTYWDEIAREVIDSEIVPRFRRGDMAAGIVAGVEALAAAVEKGPPEGGLLERTRAGEGPAPVPGGEALPPASLPPGAGEGGRWIPRGTGVGLPKPGGGFGIGTLVLIGFLVMAGLALLSVFRGARRAFSPADSAGRWTSHRGGGRGMGGWGGLLTGGLLGFFGSRLLDGLSGRRGSGRSGGTWGGSPGGFTSAGGGFSGGGGGSSFGGGYSSGGGASGSW